MIPKVIHYLWLSEEKPPEVRACIETWTRCLAGYEIIEWNKSNFPFNDFTWTREAFLKRKWAFVTDFFRLWVLDNYGGIYMDADVTMTGNFDAFLDNPMFIGTEFTDQIAAHVIGAEKGHPFIHKCLEYYTNRHFIKTDGECDMKPLPNIITKIFMQEYHYKDELVFFDNKPFIMDNILIYPDTYFTINTYNGKNVCYHNGLGSWRDNSADNPILEDVLEYYFFKKSLCYSLFRKYKGFKGIILFLMPVGILAFLYKKRTKIGNNSRVKSVKL